MRRSQHMKRQKKVDVPMAVDSSDSGQDSGHLVNRFMRVTVTSAVSRVCVNFITLTFRAPGRNHTVSTLLEATAMLCFSMNSGIAPVRSSYELSVQCTGSGRSDRMAR